MARTEWSDMGQIDGELEAILAKLPSLPPTPPTIEALRTRLQDLKSARMAAMPPSEPISDVTETDKKVTARDGFQIPIRVYQPKDPANKGPLILLFHGGGFSLGGLENEEAHCREFVQKLGAVAVNVDYRLAPESPFPAAPNDCWDALKWAAESASSLGADPSRGFILFGTSAGAQMSASLALVARRESLSPPLTGIGLLNPEVLDFRSIPDKYKNDIVSYEQNLDAPFFNSKLIDLFVDCYKPDIRSPLYNLILQEEDFHLLPPVFLQICGMDPFRDEGLLFEELLRTTANVKTRLEVYAGLPHAFWTALPQLSSSKMFNEDTLSGVQWLLEQVA